MYFTWDPPKAEANYRKHGVRFEEARIAFRDPFALWEVDSDHPDHGVLIGSPSENRVLFVVYVDLADAEDDIYRIISARKASKTQRRRYEHGDDT